MPVVRSKTTAHDPKYREHLGNKTNLQRIIRLLRRVTPEQAYRLLGQAVRNKSITIGDAQFLAHIAHGAEGELKGMKSRMKMDSASILPGMYWIKQRRKTVAKLKAKPAASKKKVRK